MLWYILDGDNTVLRASPDWAGLGIQIIGKTIWDFFSDAAPHDIYHRIFERVRASGSPISVKARCDEPTLRKELNINVKRVEDDLIEVSIETTEETPTAYQSIWDQKGSRSGETVRVCSWCQDIQVDNDRWLPFTEALEELGLLETNFPPELSHGICKSCLKKLNELD